LQYLNHNRSRRALKKPVDFKKLIVLLLVLVTSHAKYVNADSIAQTDFFREGVSARSLGLGNSMVGLADDVNSVYWNPAGLYLIKNTSFSTTRSTLDDFAGLTTQTLNLVVPYDESAFGFNLVYSSLEGGIETAIDEDTGRLVPIGTYEEDDTAFSLSYAWEYRENLYIGAALKSAKQELGGYSATGVGLDLGALMILENGMRAGIAIANLGDMDIGNDSIPMNIRIGASAPVPSVDNLMVAVSYETDYADDSVFGVGAEYEITDNLFARIGSADGEIAAGLGVGFQNFQLDYSFVENDLTGDESKLTLGYFVQTGHKTPKKAEEAKVPVKKADDTAKKEEKKVEKKDSKEEKKEVKAKTTSKRTSRSKKEEKEEKKDKEEPPAKKKTETSEKKAVEKKVEVEKKKEEAKKETAEEKTEVNEIQRKVTGQEALEPMKWPEPSEKPVQRTPEVYTGIEVEPVGAPSDGYSAPDGYIQSLDELLGEASVETYYDEDLMKSPPPVIKEGMFQLDSGESDY